MDKERDMLENFNKVIQEDIDKRAEHNMELIQVLDEFFTKFPHMRFVQGLWALNIVERDKDKFHEESGETLIKAKKALADALGKPLPCTLEEVCDIIKKKCEEAIKTYDNEEFYEDDCDMFLGEKSMAEDILEVLENYDLVKKAEDWYAKSKEIK